MLAKSGTSFCVTLFCFDRILNSFDMLGKDFLNQYRGRDNSEEVYEWKLKFHERMFDDVSRIKEAKKNIEHEDERYNCIRKELKK